MTSTLAAPSVLLGDQRPRLWSAPASESSEGDRVADLAKAVGLDLDDWERWVLAEGLGRARDGKWSAFEKALIVSRQNGKGAILEALELAALFLDDFDVELILHSAHEFKTASEAFRRVQGRIDRHPSFRRRVRQVYLQRGAESIELRNGKRLRFIARTSGSGKGFSADLVILDEAFDLGDQEMAALLPTLSARPNPQVWYTSTAGLPTSAQLGRVRERGLRCDPSLAFFEWSVDPDAYDPADLADWARANPGMGIRITPEYIAKERAALAPDEFARERLGVGSYPVTGGGWAVVPEAAWLLLADAESQLPEAAPVAFAADATAGQSHGAIAAAGIRPDGRLHAEVIEHDKGTAWIPGRLAELNAAWGPSAVVIDPKRGASSRIAAAESLGVEVTQPTAREMAQACGGFYVAACDSKLLVHLGQAPLDFALARAVKRELADSWAWDAPRGVDISPLVAVTLAARAAAAGTAQFFGSWR